MNKQLIIFLFFLVIAGCGVKSDVVPPKNAWFIFEPSEQPTETQKKKKKEQKSFSR